MKNNFMNVVLICSSLVFSIPSAAISTTPIQASTSILSSDNFEPTILTLFQNANRGNMNGVQLQLQIIAERIGQSTDPLADSHQFLIELVNQLNAQYGISCTLAALLNMTRESMTLFQIPEDHIEKCITGCDLIEGYQSYLCETDSAELVYLAKHHKSKNYFWHWLTVATISAAAATVCIVVPQTAPLVISGAVEVGKAAVGK
jgi:hypothetical protein